MSWTKEEQKFILQTYRRQPLVLVKGKGSFVWDESGKRYLDFFSGLAVNNLGHCHPAVVKAVADQAKKLIHTSNIYYTIPQIECARTLVQRSFPGKVFFCNSGAEANETAIKLARRWGKQGEGSRVKCEGRHEIIAFSNSFHGRTMGALTLTAQQKYQKDFDPLLEKVLYAEFNNSESVGELVSERTCAIFVEPIQGEGGIVPATKEFLHDLRDLCDQNKMLLVFDEVQCGMGRTGYLFAYQGYGVEPDVLLLAKGLGGGLPIGAVIVKEEFTDLFGLGDHASTFGGNPVTCSAAKAVLKTMSAPFLKEVKKKGEIFRAALEALKEKNANIVKEVRGEGLMQGIVLIRQGAGIVDACREAGLLINCTQETVLRLVPPLTISAGELKAGVQILEKALNS